MFKFGGLFNMVGNDMPNIKRGQVQRYDPNQRQEPTRYDPSQRQDPIRYNPNQRQEATEVFWNSWRSFSKYETVSTINS